MLTPAQRTYFARKRQRRRWIPYDALAAFDLPNGRYALPSAGASTPIEATYSEALDESGSPRVYLVPNDTYDVTFQYSDNADEIFTGAVVSGGSGYSEPTLASANITYVIFRAG